MFYYVEDDLFSMIEAEQHDAVDFIDFMLIAHRMGHLVLTLTRRQILRLNRLLALSALSKKMLSFISNKSNDYIAAAKLAPRVVRVCTDSLTPNLLFHATEVFVNYRVISIEHALTQKFVLGESFRDSGMFELLAKSYLRSTAYPESLIRFRALAGGGGNLCHVLAAERPAPIKGIVVCDCDTHIAVPPFPTNSTGQKAWDQAKMLGLVQNKIGVSDSNPFFAFTSTHGRTIENMVRPYLLDFYFAANSGSRAQRADFVAAFPHFPDLSAEEVALWNILNLKDGTANLAAVFGEIRNLFGSVPMNVGLRSNVLSALKLPSDVIDWVIRHGEASQFAKGIVKAIHNDLNEAGYNDTVKSWASLLLHIAAGDVSARRS